MRAVIHKKGQDEPKIMELREFRPMIHFAVLKEVSVIRGEVDLSKFEPGMEEEVYEYEKKSLVKDKNGNIKEAHYYILENKNNFSIKIDDNFLLKDSIDKKKKIFKFLKDSIFAKSKLRK